MLPQSFRSLYSECEGYVDFGFHFFSFHSVKIIVPAVDGDDRVCYTTIVGEHKHSPNKASIVFLC